MPSGRETGERERLDSPDEGLDAAASGIVALLTRHGIDTKVIDEARELIDAAGVFIPEAVPKFRDKKGKIDPDHFRVRLKNLVDENVFLQRMGKKGVANFALARDLIFREAKMAGLDPKGLLDERSVDERGYELGMRIIGAPASTWEGLDDELDHIEESVRSAVNGSKEIIEGYEEERRREAEGIRRSGKAFLRRLARIRRLRAAVKHPRPERSDPITGGGKWPSLSTDMHMAWAASRPLRTLCYVYRSDRSDIHPIFDIGPHHCKMAVDLYIARNRMIYLVEGTPEECAQHPTVFAPTGKAGWRRNTTECRGIVVLVPPRHTKSMVGTAWLVTEFNDNPRLQAMMGHAIVGQCGTNMRFVKAAFSSNEPQGRRNLSIFPAQLADSDNDQWRMRLANAEPTRDPQLRAYGITGSVGGGNADIIWLDDPVDPKQVTEDTTREKTLRLITGQWLRRLQGSDSFLLITATPWHPDDAVMSLVSGARAGEMDFAVSRQPVGGPEAGENGEEPFFSIWKGQPSSSIRRAFKEMNDPWAFSCQFALNPTPKSSQIIQQIALYVSDISQCPNPPEDMVERWKQHRAFLRAAECHLSLDPSATSESRAAELRKAGDKTRRDKSGLVYMGMGSASDPATLEGMIETRTRIRILHAKTFYASPQEAVLILGEYCGSRRVDAVHIEAVTGFVAISEAMRNEYGLGNDQVIEHKSGSLSKKARLRAVAPMIDDAPRLKGAEPAVVEFPGILNEQGVLVVDPEYKWLTDSVLMFGFTKNDHCVDAITQVCKFLAPIVGVGMGSVSNRVRAAQAEDLLSDREMRARKLADAYREADEARAELDMSGAAYA